MRIGLRDSDVVNNIIPFDMHSVCERLYTASPPSFVHTVYCDSKKGRFLILEVAGLTQRIPIRGLQAFQCKLSCRAA